MPVRTDLWPTPLWQIDLGDVLVEHPSLVGEALAYLDAHRLPEHPLQQSAPDLGTAGPATAAGLARLEAVARELARREFVVRDGQNVVTYRSWVVRSDGSGDWDESSAALLHSHLPSLLSAVWYLQVPDGFEGSAEVGTTFRPAVPALHRLLRQPLSWTVPGRTGHVVFFPSWVEHVPAPAPPGRHFLPPRVAVACDYVLIG